jgi:hypothetical protein
MAQSKKEVQKVSFTSTEMVSLPSETSPAMGIRSRDWKNLRRSVENLSNQTKGWDYLFTISTTIFFSFLLPALTTGGNLEKWKLLFWIVTLVSLGVGITSLSVVLSVRKRSETERSDIIELMDEIQSLYVSDSDETIKTTAPPYVGNRIYDEDTLYKEAREIAYNEGKISTSLLQRRMRIGYARAARIVEHMERDGIVGQSDGARPRPVIR